MPTPNYSAMIAPRLLAGLLAIAVPSVAVADSYRLVSGDKVEVYIAGNDDAVLTTVDTDGQIRLRNVGGVTVRGLTLDEAEDVVESEMERLAGFVDPQISLIAVSYAPVVISGDVSNPGSFDYVPGMTVASALAISGGSDTPTSTRADLVRIQATAESDLKIGNLDIASAIVDQAYYTALLAGGDTAIDVTDTMRARIPAPNAADLDGLIADASAQLSARRERGAQLMAFWQREIETADQQQDIYTKRIAVYEDIASGTQKSLEAARELSERGLQTTARLTDAETRAAEAQSRVLELESARMSAARAKSVAERERVQFLSALKQDGTEGRRNAATNVERHILTYQRNLKLLAALSDANSSGIIATEGETLLLTFDIQSAPGSAKRDGKITLSTPVLPGDNLIVRIDPFGAAN